MITGENRVKQIWGLCDDYLCGGGKRKTPLPGISASQQSVREFFKLKLKEPVAVVSEGVTGETGDECGVVVKCAKLVPGLQEAKNFQTGGEGPSVNSAELHGGYRPKYIHQEKQEISFQSPTKINKQSGSVAELRTLFLVKSVGEGAQKK